MEELDDSWIHEFETTEKKYKYFYKADIHSIKIHFVYMSKDFTIEKIKEEKINLKTLNILSRDEIVYLIKNNHLDNRIKYSLFSILKYNIDLEPSELKPFLKSTALSSSFLTPIRNIDSISFEPSIDMFQDLNHLFFFYLQPNESVKLNNKTRRIFIHSKNKNKTVKNL